MRPRVRLDGAQAVVTGAGGPVGRAVAVALADAGSDVVCVDADEAAADTTAASCADRGVSARAFAADLGDPATGSALAGRLHAELTGIDVLVTVSGAGPVGRLPPLGPAGWAAGRSAHLDAVVHAVQLLGPTPGARRAQVVHVVPAAALLAGPDQPVGAAAVAGLAALSLAMRADRRRSRVGVSLVCAGRTATPGEAPAGRGSLVPRRRPGGGGQAPEAVAAAVLRAIRSDRAVVHAGLDARLAWHLHRMLPATAHRLPTRAPGPPWATSAGPAAPTGVPAVR
jgi:short-subunit dehydrogenase